MNHCLIFNVFDTTRFSAGRSLGAYRIAHYLRTKGWDVEVIEYAMDWSLSELQELCKSRVKSNTKFFGFSHMFSVWSPTLETFIEWSRKNYPDLKYISGGPANPYFESNQIDYYVRGYGEKAIISLLDYLFSNGELPRFWINTGRKIINAIADYPAYPDQDLSVRYEKRDFINPHEWLSMEFARGCMFSCKFCNFPLIGVKDDTTRSSESFEEDMKRNYDDFGVSNYVVVDETFNDRPSKIKKFADSVEKLSFEPFFTGFIRPDLLVSRPNDRVDLARMNFRGHYYGVESFNLASAKSVGKGMNPERLKQGLLEIRDYFKNTGNGLYRGSIGLIVGLPHETEQSLLSTRDWLADNWKDESVIIWTLEIPQDEIQTKSMFSDYKKYGYTSMTEEEIKTKTPMNESAKTAIERFSGSVVWKTDYLDLFKADDIVHNVFLEQGFLKTMNAKLDNFDLASMNLGNKGIHSRLLDDSTRIENKQLAYMRDVIRESLIETYKRKKLSL